MRGIPNAFACRRSVCSVAVDAVRAPLPVRLQHEVPHFERLRGPLPSGQLALQSGIRSANASAVSVRSPRWMACCTSCTEGASSHMAGHADAALDLLRSALDAEFPARRRSVLRPSSAAVPCTPIVPCRVPAELRQPLVPAGERPQIRLPQVHIQRDRPFHQTLIGGHSGQAPYRPADAGRRRGPPGLPAGSAPVPAIVAAHRPERSARPGREDSAVLQAEDSGQPAAAVPAMFPTAAPGGSLVRSWGPGEP